MTGETSAQEMNSFTEDTVSLIRHDGEEQVHVREPCGLLHKNYVRRYLLKIRNQDNFV